MLPLGPTRLAVWIGWFPAPQAKSRTRRPVRMPAISISVSVAADRPAENSFSHFAQPGAAFSQVLRSSDFVVASAVLETGFSEGISFPAQVRRPLSNRTYRARLANFVTKNLNSARCSKSISGTDRPDYRCTFCVGKRPRQVGAARNKLRSKLMSALGQKRTCAVQLSCRFYPRKAVIGQGDLSTIYR